MQIRGKWWGKIIQVRKNYIIQLSGSISNELKMNLERNKKKFKASNRTKSICIYYFNFILFYWVRTLYGINHYMVLSCTIKFKLVSRI
jgi:hypothetical protein